MLCVIYAKKENSMEADGGTRYVYVAQKQQHKIKKLYTLNVSIYKVRITTHTLTYK